MQTKLVQAFSVAAAALMALPASADETVYYDPVSAIAGAHYGAFCHGLGVFDNALDWWGRSDTDKLVAAANAGSASGGAALSLPNVAVAMANASGGGGCTGSAALGILTGRATIYDPQGRGSIKLRVKFNAAGSSAAPNAERHSMTGWSLRIADGLDVQPYATFDAFGDIVNLFSPDLLNQHMIFQIYGATGAAGYQEGGVDASWICDSVGGCANINGYTTELASTVVIDSAPGTLWFQLRADAAEEGVAIIDPIIEPDPSNPDVVVTMEGPRGSGGYAPLAGVTAEQLVARGIDPGPFIRLGFLDASVPPPPPPPLPPPVSDATAPITLASATPAANAFGWNKAAVTVTLGAIDNAGGSGAKELHYSLDGATTGSQVIPGGSATVPISADGATTLSYFAVDNAGNRETTRTLTVRIDKKPPTVTGLPSTCTLWPPDHRLVQVASVTGDDAISGLVGAPEVTATSNEPENGTGDGDVAPDVVIAGGTVQLRAERAGNGAGRIYRITATATDLAGNTAPRTVSCTVPHD